MMLSSKAAKLASTDSLFNRGLPEGFADGRGAGSVGVKFQHVKESPLPTGGPGEFHLFAGMNNCLRYCNNNGNTDENHKIYPFDKSPRYEKHTISNPGGGNWASYKPRAGQDLITSWRTVAVGLKLTLTNNQDQDDGWFEAIRVDPQWEGLEQVGAWEQRENDLIAGLGDTGYSREQDEAATADKQHVRTRFTLFIDKEQNLSGHPSYVTGKIRDLHHFVFRLNRRGKDHPFTRMQTEQTKARLWPDTGISPFFDGNFDNIIIRLHPRTVDPNTRLLVNVISTVQITYDEKSLLGQVAVELFKARSRKMPGRKRKMRKRKIIKRRKRVYKK